MIITRPIAITGLSFILISIFPAPGKSQALQSGETASWQAWDGATHGMNDEAIMQLAAEVDYGAIEELGTQFQQKSQKKGANTGGLGGSPAQQTEGYLTPYQTQPSSPGADASPAYVGGEQPGDSPRRGRLTWESLREGPNLRGREMEGTPGMGGMQGGDDPIEIPSFENVNL